MVLDCNPSLMGGGGHRRPRRPSHGDKTAEHAEIAEAAPPVGETWHGHLAHGWQRTHGSRPAEDRRCQKDGACAPSAISAVSPSRDWGITLDSARNRRPQLRIRPLRVGGCCRRGITPAAFSTAHQQGRRLSGPPSRQSSSPLRGAPCEPPV